MPQIRRLLLPSVVETAQRRRTCYRDRKEHLIDKGVQCLVIKDPATGHAKNYCAQCALAILDRAADDLQELRSQLS